MIVAAERRRARRVASGALPDDLVGRIRPGHQVRVLNMSSCGVLIETSRRLPPGMIVELHLEVRERRHTIRAQVVRCYVGVVLPQLLVFRGALDFERSLAWVSELPEVVAATAGALRIGQSG